MGGWNELRLEAQGDQFDAWLNGRWTASFTNPDRYRGKPASADRHAGFVGVLMSKGCGSIRRIEIEERPRASSADDRPP